MEKLVVMLGMKSAGGVDFDQGHRSAKVFENFSAEHGTPAVPPCHR
jgi:hypothetical protein